MNWPFSLKLLWAPIVDSIYSNRFGRRKSWLIPAQLLIGFFMIFLGANVDSWLGDVGVNIVYYSSYTLKFIHVSCFCFLSSRELALIHL